MFIAMARIPNRQELNLPNIGTVLLTEAQFDLYSKLSTTVGSPVKVEYLLQSLDISVGTLRVLVCQLRKALAGYAKIKSKRGVSYTLLEV